MTDYLKIDSVDILGTKYSVKFSNEKEDKWLKNIDGYCNGLIKQIVIKDLADEGHEGWTDKEKQINQKNNLRHEVVHAFLNECGLMQNSIVYNEGWATNEEMVDWIARQFPKMLKAFKEIGVIE